MYTSSPPPTPTPPGSGEVALKEARTDVGGVGRCRNFEAQRYASVLFRSRFEALEESLTAQGMQTELWPEISSCNYSFVEN